MLYVFVRILLKIQYLNRYTSTDGKDNLFAVETTIPAFGPHYASCTGVDIKADFIASAVPVQQWTKLAHMKIAPFCHTWEKEGLLMDFH